MKILKVISIVIFFVSLCGCGQKINTNVLATDNTGKTSAVEDNSHLDFPQYGFSIDAPCLMEDVSSQSSGNFLINYGGITDGDSPEKMAAYQLVVNKTPIKYSDLPKEEYEKAVDEALKSQANRFTSFKAVKFSDDALPGYICETTHNGYGQKGVLFSLDNYIIAMTVITNNDLESKFKKFTNGFKRTKIKQ